MTFLSFIKTQPITDDPEGDFIKDTLSVSDFPKTKVKDKIKFYLWARRACPEAMEAFEVLWDRYKRYEAIIQEERKRGRANERH